MSKFFCNGADAECNCPILCADCSSVDWTGGTEIKTNADHIRSMTDEELADFMSEHSTDDFCYIICGGECNAVATFNKTSGQRCREIVSNWLKQPYKEDT